MPEHFKIAVIGAGPGGYIAALKGAQMGASTAVIENYLLGGVCLNNGCIPSKILLASAELINKIEHADSLGVKVNGTVSFDWPAIQHRKDLILSKLRGGIKGLFNSRKIKLYQASAKFISANELTLEDKNGQTQRITADNIIIASGSNPTSIPGWPMDREYVSTSDEALHWKRLPRRLLIVGGGFIGCEFACMMAQYGVEVTVVEMLDNLLPEMETSLGKSLIDIFKKRKIQVFTGAKVEKLEIKDSRVGAVISNGSNIEVDKVLVAVGRKPNTQNLGLEKIGLQTDRGFIRVNDKMQTDIKNVYCIGDANGRVLLAHAASAQGVIAIENVLGHQKEFNLPVPMAVYTFPEIASVGLTTKQAQQQNLPVSIGQFPLSYLGKAMSVGEETGFVKVIRHRDDEALLGVHILGHNATEVIEAATAMIGLKANARQLAEMIFAHPTISEAVKEAAEDSFEMALNLPPRKAAKLPIQ